MTVQATSCVHHLAGTSGLDSSKATRVRPEKRHSCSLLDPHQCSTSHWRRTVLYRSIHTPFTFVLEQVVRHVDRLLVGDVKNVVDDGFGKVGRDVVVSDTFRNGVVPARRHITTMRRRGRPELLYLYKVCTRSTAY